METIEDVGKVMSSYGGSKCFTDGLESRSSLQAYEPSFCGGTEDQGRQGACITNGSSYKRHIHLHYQHRTGRGNGYRTVSDKNFTVPSDEISEQHIYFRSAYDIQAHGQTQGKFLIDGCSFYLSLTNRLEAHRWKVSWSDSYSKGCSRSPSIKIKDIVESNTIYVV